MSLPKFFLENEFFIDEKVNFFKFENAYKVYDQFGEKIGTVEQDLGVVQKILQMFFSKAMMPFKFEVKDTDGQVIAGLRRGWTIWMSKIEVIDQDQRVIGYIQQKFKLIKPSFTILDAHENQVAIIKGEWKAWDFKILDENEKTIGTINKKWAGVAKELFTTADKYKVSIDAAYKEDERKVAIIVAAITIDMVLKERK